MTTDTQLRRLGRLEAELATTSGSDLAGRLGEARQRPYQPTHMKDELQALAERTTHEGAVARGLLRLGEAYWLASTARRKAPELNVEETLVAVMGALSGDPEAFAEFQGWKLRKWQRKVLQRIRDDLAAGQLVGLGEAIQQAVSSGHGVGKSALVAMLILWALSTFEDTRVVVTANTEGQLASKTMPELALWHRKAINAHWFVFTATALYSCDKRHEKNWRCDAIPWNETRPESFAGLHNQGKRILLVFDEASAIADKIWETAEGALTDADTQMIWLACGNPTRGTGRFFECLVGKLASRWRPVFIDAQEVEGVSPEQIAAYRDYYGADSNWFRVRVRGLPPLTDDTAFFNRTEVQEAMQRPAIEPDRGHPMVIGADIARRGGDATVLTFRRHLDARSFPQIKLYGLDLMAIAARIAAEANSMKALGLRVVLMVDGTGIGSGVVDRLRQLGYTAVDVQFAGKAPDPAMYANLRAHMHGELRNWIRKGGALPNDSRLLEQMAAIEYGHTPTGQVLLERKDDLRDRLGHSPDELDSLCCTFAVPVAVELDEASKPKRDQRGHDPYAYMARGHDPYRSRGRR